MYAVNVTSPDRLPLVSGCQNSGVVCGQSKDTHHGGSLYFFYQKASEQELPILFEIFFDMLLAAWGFGGVWVALDFGVSNNLCLVLSLG